VIGAQGDSTIGVHGSQSYHWEMPGELNATFVKAYEARYKKKPSFLGGDAYMTIQLLHAAIVKAKSADIAAVRAALPGLKTNSIVGEVEMRAADQQLLRPLALTEVTKGSDGMGVITLKSVAPAGQITPPISPDCKM